MSESYRTICDDIRARIDKCIQLLNAKPKRTKAVIKKKMEIIPSHILHFFSKGEGRETNDANNKIRESILEHILSNKYTAYFTDPEYGSKWVLMKSSWQEALSDVFQKKKTNVNITYTSLKVIKKAGRKYNYDFTVEYYNESSLVLSANIEFKHGGTCIEELPEFYNPDSKKDFLSGYAEYFYDNYVTKYAHWSTNSPPDKATYLKSVFANTSKLPFFKTLKTNEDDEKSQMVKNGKSQYSGPIYKDKSRLCAESIEKFLEATHTTLNLEKLTLEFENSQKNKIFLIWNCDKFHIDEFDSDDLRVTTIIGLNQQKNTILINSASGKIQYELLLRWKNRLGILYPAWQISLRRLATQTQSQS